MVFEIDSAHLPDRKTMQIIEQLWTPLLQILLITNLQLFQSSPFGLVFRFWHCVCMKITPDLQKKNPAECHINLTLISCRFRAKLSTCSSAYVFAINCWHEPVSPLALARGPLAQFPSLKAERLTRVQWREVVEKWLFIRFSCFPVTFSQRFPRDGCCT